VSVLASVATVFWKFMQLKPGKSDKDIYKSLIIVFIWIACLPPYPSFVYNCSDIDVHWTVA